jgi:hypothetical protein
LQSKFQAAFHRFGTAGNVDHILQGAAAAGRDDFRQFFQCISGEIIAIAVRDAIQLLFDGVVHLFIGVADAIDGRAAGTINILLAIDIVEIRTLGPGNLREVAGRMDILRKVGHGITGHLKSCR